MSADDATAGGATQRRAGLTGECPGGTIAAHARPSRDSENARGTLSADRASPAVAGASRPRASVRIAIVTPAPGGSRTGNRITAERYERFLRALGHDVQVEEAW